MLHERTGGKAARPHGPSPVARYAAGRSWAKGLRSLILFHLGKRGPMTLAEAANACQVKV